MTVCFRPWRENDAADLAESANNPNIAKWLRDVFPSPYTLEAAEAYIKSCIESENDCLCRAIEINGHAVGSVGIFPASDVYKKSGELGYWLSEEYWGKGIMTQAVRQLCAEAAEKFGLIRIYSEPFADNTGSRRVLEKAGFSLEGIMKNGVYKNGEFHDYCMYSLLK